jgi:predicted NBD/HSP70 family sugar kinase
LANNELLREINAIRCLRALRSSRILSRSEIGRTLDLSRMTVGNAVRTLLAKNLVIETEEPVLLASAGRPGINVKLNPAGAYFVGIDVSTTMMNVVLVDLTMKVIARSSRPVDGLFRDTDGMVQIFASVPGELLKEARVPAKRLAGIGISVPGIVSRSGRVLSAPYLGWLDFDLQPQLSKELKSKWPVRVINDAAAFANSVLAERPEGDLADALVVLLAEGIGSSQLRQGQVVSGAHGFAGEIGHMIFGVNSTTATPETFEMLAGYGCFLPLLPSKLSIAEGLTALAASGKRSRRDSEVLDRWATALSIGLLNCIHTLDPERIILGGPLTVLYPVVEQQVTDAITRGLVHGFTIPPLEVARSGADSAALGAASTMREELFALPELHST